MLAELGVFIGARVDQNAESTYMQRLNRRVLDEIGAHWSTPLEAHRIVSETLESGELNGLAQAIGEYLDGTWFDLEFWGVRRRSRLLPWGWKDPRNILLLPLYRAVFGDMKIVWVRRHPMETARSLDVRESARQGDYASLASDAGIRQEAKRAMRLLRGMPLASPAWRTSSLRGAVELSIEYAELHHRILPAMPVELIQIDYSDLLRQPAETAALMAEFVGVSSTSAGVKAASRLPRQGPVTDFRDDIDLGCLSSEFGDRLRSLGYGP